MHARTRVGELLYTSLPIWIMTDHIDPATLERHDHEQPIDTSTIASLRRRNAICDLAARVQEVSDVSSYWPAPDIQHPHLQAFAPINPHVATPAWIDKDPMCVSQTIVESVEDYVPYDKTMSVNQSHVQRPASAQHAFVLEQEQQMPYDPVQYTAWPTEYTNAIHCGGTAGYSGGVEQNMAPIPWEQMYPLPNNVFAQQEYQNLGAYAHEHLNQNVAHGDDFVDELTMAVPFEVFPFSHDPTRAWNDEFVMGIGQSQQCHGTSVGGADGVQAEHDVAALAIRVADCEIAEHQAEW